MSAPGFAIPLNRPSSPPELETNLLAVARSSHRCGAGPFMARAEAQLSNHFPDAAGVLLTTSCTHALELSVVSLGIGPGDEVIVPSFCFPAVANSAVLRGATVRFSDADPSHLGSSVNSIASLLGSATKAVIALHYGGIDCGISALKPLLADRGVALIEDNAHGLFASSENGLLGSHGRFSTLSFHDTKHVSAGECGALVVNDPTLVSQAHTARSSGTNRAAFLSGEADRYGWVATGSSWVPSEYVAAALCAALDDAPRTQALRHNIILRYAQELCSWAERVGAALMPLESSTGGAVGTNDYQVAHSTNTFYLVTRDSSFQTGLLAHLNSHGIGAAFHYSPLHQSPAAHALGLSDRCPVAESVARRIVRLPVWADMSDEQITFVIQRTVGYLGGPT